MTAHLRTIGALVLLAATLLSRDGRADVADEAWKRGNEAHLRGDYAAAAKAYENLQRQMILSPDLFYNLGVTYFRQQKLGRAVWAFERALVLAPDDEDARFNLAQARKLAGQRAQDKLEGVAHEPWWIRTVTSLSPSTEVWLFCGLYLGCFVLVFLRRGMAHDARLAVTTGVVILGVAAALAGLLVLGRVQLDRIPMAIVLPDQVAVKEGADENFRTSFEVHGGLRVRVLESEHDWVRVRLANGLEGYVRAEDVGLL
jgi:hypothetical protein